MMGVMKAHIKIIEFFVYKLWLDISIDLTLAKISKMF